MSVDERADKRVEKLVDLRVHLWVNWRVECYYDQMRSCKINDFNK